MRPRLSLLVLPLAAGCDVWISDKDFDDYEEAHCKLEFDALDGDGDGYLPLDAALPDHCPYTFDELIVSEGLLEGDCDDTDASSFPGAPDPCDDQIDQDCDGVDPHASDYYEDLDQDGYGDPDTKEAFCESPPARVQDDQDCDDTDPDVSPAGVEAACADEVDGDCDGVTECALNDEVDLSRSGWSAYGTKLTLSASLTEATFATGEDLNGDGLRDAAIATSDSVLGLTWDGEGVAAESISPGSTSPSPGALAMLPDPVHSGGIALAWGDPGDGSEGAGQVVVRSLEGETVVLSAGSEESNLGLFMGDGQDSLLVLAHTRETVPNWNVVVLNDNDLPSSDAAIADVETARLNLGQATTGSMIGFSVAPRPDGDGLVAAWAPGVSDPDELQWYTGPLESDSAPHLTVTHGSRTGGFGAASVVVDLDASGVDDLIVGTANSARVYVYLDPTDGGEIASDDADVKPDGIGNFGATLAAVGDLNGDGAEDLTIGISENDKVALLLGGITPVDSAYSAPYARLAGSAGGALGSALASGDLDGDGFSDLLVTEPGSGALYLLWGGP